MLRSRSDIDNRRSGTILPLHHTVSTETKAPKPSDGITLRSLRAKDREIIQKLHEEWFPVRYEADFYRELCENQTFGGDPVVSYVAVQGDKICGCLVGQMMSKSKLSPRLQRRLAPRHPHVFYIMTIGVCQDFRHRGLGTHLVEHCRQQLLLQNDDCAGIFLHVITYNHAAICFYEQRLDFRRVDELKDYYVIDQVPYNCFIYARNLDDERYFCAALWHRTVDWWNILYEALWPWRWCLQRRGYSSSSS